MNLHALAKEFGMTISGTKYWLCRQGFVLSGGSTGTRYYFDTVTVSKIHHARSLYLAERAYGQDASIGTQFGMLTVVGEAVPYRQKNTKRWRIPCQCKCGNMAAPDIRTLRAGDTVSCGCWTKERTRAVNTKHGGARRDTSNRLYQCWVAMKHRCYNPKCENYPNYGGRGIDICPEWLDFDTFRIWANSHGYDNKLTLDRADNDLGYWPENCRWATMLEQQNNRRSCVPIEAWGETKTIAEWSRDPRCKVCHSTLNKRLSDSFWEPENAISAPSSRSVFWGM